MRLQCFYCGKSVSNEVPDGTIVRACLECPECIETRDIQKEQFEWSKKNFGESPAYRPLLGAMEELGELAHAHLKEEQGIRGTPETLQADAQDAVGDIVIYLMNYCSIRGWDFEQIVKDTWNAVKKRDWTKNRKDGKDEQSS